MKLLSSRSDELAVKVFIVFYESLKTDIPVKTLVLKYGLLKENELDSILDPYAMTEARTRQTQAKAV